MFKLGDRSIVEVLERGLVSIGETIQTKHGYFKINSLSQVTNSKFLKGSFKRINDKYCIACLIDELIHWIELEHIFDVEEIDIQFGSNYDQAYVGSNAN